MKSAFVLQHMYESKDETENIAFIGVYSSRKAGLAAIERLRTRPGFRDYPDLVEEKSGFYLAEYEIDLDHWVDGIATA